MNDDSSLPLTDEIKLILYAREGQEIVPNPGFMLATLKKINTYR
jgi:hypothetical protein